ncbi:unnamed protein product [Clonostachys byssicola]|uniref:Uncharacterized protein n=1 Tax=Clonostachys byssicola TaxID=160290 RepID=A0A9N9US94_9HYPO|nr:unnamed protein product [Clonostachys byssicola]
MRHSTFITGNTCYSPNSLVQLPQLFFVSEIHDNRLIKSETRESGPININEEHLNTGMGPTHAIADTVLDKNASTLLLKLKHKNHPHEHNAAEEPPDMACNSQLAAGFEKYRRTASLLQHATSPQSSSYQSGTVRHYALANCRPLADTEP